MRLGKREEFRALPADSSIVILTGYRDAGQGGLQAPSLFWRSDIPHLQDTIYTHPWAGVKERQKDTFLGYQLSLNFIHSGARYYFVL